MPLKMSEIHPEMDAVIKKYNFDPNKACWGLKQANNMPILKHEYAEEIARIENITFDAPVIIRNEPSDICVLVTGHKDDKTVWSFGEASKSNNKNAYPFAMAEKRGKDRVIFKLAGLKILSEVDLADPEAKTKNEMFNINPTKAA